MGPVMTVKDKIVYLSGIDDGTGVNPQKGYFRIKEMIGPFKTKADAEMNLD